MRSINWSTTLKKDLVEYSTTGHIQPINSMKKRERLFLTMFRSRYRASRSQKEGLANAVSAVPYGENRSTMATSRPANVTEINIVIGDDTGFLKGAKPSGPLVRHLRFLARRRAAEG